MNLRLSFIVPFYNVEPYIEECIRSLYAQDIPWDEYEVICVDDCSPDGSRAIVERLQREYPTLQLLTTPENLRQGGARNMALDVARGRYVFFVDSDDYIKPNCLAALLKQAENENLDILDFDFESDAIGESNGMYKNPVSYSMGVCTGDDYVFDSRIHWANKCSSVCAMLIRRDFIETHNLRFVEKKQFEDTDFSMKMFSSAKRVMHIGDRLYLYRHHTSSATHSTPDFNNIYYRVEAIKRFIQLYRSNKNTRWGVAIQEIIKNDTYELLYILRQTSLKNRCCFYVRRLGYIRSLRLFVGKKVILALNSLVLLHYFYKK